MPSYRLRRGLRLVRDEHFVSRQRQKFLEVFGCRDAQEQVAGLLEPAAVEPGRSELIAYACELFCRELLHERSGDESSIIERAPMAQPLPNLRAADFRGRRVFHQVVYGNRALPA